MNFSVEHETRQKVIELYALGQRRLKPNQILRALTKMGAVVPMKKDLYNYMALMKKNVFGQCDLNLGELGKLLTDNSTIPTGILRSHQ